MVPCHIFQEGTDLCFLLYMSMKLCNLQHGYQILVVELVCSDVTVWTKRLEERARQDKGSHKPGGAAEMQMILDRYWPSVNNSSSESNTLQQQGFQHVSTTCACLIHAGYSMLNRVL